MGIPPPGPGAGIVGRQRLHDLDRPRVFREHHLALRAVDVVADVELRRISGSCPRTAGKRPSSTERGVPDAEGRLFAPPGDMPPVWIDNFFGSSLFVACCRPRLEEVQLQHVMRRRVGLEMRVEERHRPGGLDHPAHQVEFIADHRTGKAVARHHHGGQRHPRIDRRVVRLDAVIRADQAVGRDLAARHIDQLAVRAPGPAASGIRHPLSRSTPRVGHGTVRLHRIRVGGGQDEGVAGAAADHVDLAVDDAAVRVIARHRHRGAALPLVRGGVVHFVGGEHLGRSVRGEERVLGCFHRGGATDHVDLAAVFGGQCGAAPGGHRRQRLPGIGGRIVLPHVVNRLPCGAEGDRGVGLGARSHRRRKSCRSERPWPRGGPAAASTFSATHLSVAGSYS